MGSEFPWSNKQGSDTRTWARLDRVLVNPAWLAIFPASYALSLPPGLSDHSPLMVSVASDSPVKRRFSFLNAWQDHPDYQSLIQSAWNTPCYGTPMYQLFFKLKSVKSSLQQLHKRNFSNITERVQELRGQLEDCQNELQTYLFSPFLIAKEKNLAAQYAKLSKIEVDILFQKAKVNNIRKRDCSSSFFFSKIALRRHHSTIGIIRDKDGTTIYGIDNVNSAFVDYYTRWVFIWLFKKDWDTARDTLCVVVEEFFRKGRMMRKVNTTLLALVPKKEVPLAVQDFRPIACCYVVYKTISKIIANRLQSVLSDLVGSEQTAFIKGRNKYL
ncbi:uncharacterized protein LOC141640174 [Silene latifolia]|uniref:uncharacterized protein LOC141640174 n=1 Tax=Silene latifolia TaxID=37657 RepID=UPI003D784E3D